MSDVEQVPSVGEPNLGVEALESFEQLLDVLELKVLGGLDELCESSESEAKRRREVSSNCRRVTAVSGGRGDSRTV